MSSSSIPSVPVSSGQAQESWGDWSTRNLCSCLGLTVRAMCQAGYAFFRTCCNCDANEGSTYVRSSKKNEMEAIVSDIDSCRKQIEEVDGAMDQAKMQFQTLKMEKQELSTRMEKLLAELNKRLPGTGQPQPSVFNRSFQTQPQQQYQDQGLPTGRGPMGDVFDELHRRVPRSGVTAVEEDISN